MDISIVRFYSQWDNIYSHIIYTMLGVANTPKKTRGPTLECVISSPTNNRKQTHTRTYARTHTHTRTRIHAHTHTDAHIRTHAHMHTHARTNFISVARIATIAMCIQIVNNDKQGWIFFRWQLANNPPPPAGCQQPPGRLSTSVSSGTSDLQAGNKKYVRWHW